MTRNVFHSNQNAGAWLDTMPTIPLARAVPVIAWHRWDRDSIVRVPSFEDGTRFNSPGPWRVDLDDPQGFAYALRYLLSLIGSSSDAWILDLGGDRDAFDALCWRGLLGSTSDRDRVELARALARALAEVTR